MERARVHAPSLSRDNDLYRRVPIRVLWELQFEEELMPTKWTDKHQLLGATGPSASSQSEIYDSDRDTVVSVDGLSRVATGPASSILEFFTVRDAVLLPSGQLKEIREVTLRVRIPTLQLFEALNTIITGLRPQVTLLPEAVDQYKTQLVAVMQTVLGPKPKD